MTPASVPLRDGLLAELRGELGRFPVYIQERGRIYHRSGRVGDLVFSPGSVHANVSGTRVYQTQWHLGDSGWRPACTCPAGPWCKHAHALGLALLTSIPSIHDEDPRAIDVLVTAMTERGRAARMRTTTPATARARGASGSATGFAPPPPARASLAQLRRASTRWGRARVLDDMLRDAGLGAVRADDPAIVPVLDEHDPELLPWRLAAAIAAKTRGAVPPALRPYLDRADLEARFRSARAPGVAAALREWYAPAGGRTERTLRLELDLEDTTDAIRIVVEPRVTSVRLRDARRNPGQSRSLLAEARRRRGVLSPAHLELLEALVELQDAYDTYGATWPARSPRGPMADFLARVLPSPDVTWSRALDAEIAGAIGIEPGSPVRYDTARVRFEPALEPEDGEARLGLAVVWPDGRRMSLASVRHATDHAHGGAPGLGVVIADGVVYPVAAAPPPELMEQLRTPLRLDRESGGELLRSLSRTVPSIARTAGAFARRHAVMPVALLRLDPDDWLQVRLLAAPPDWTPGTRTAPGTPLFEFGSDGAWQPLARAPRAGAATVEADATDATDAADATDMADVAPVADTADPAPADAPADAGAAEPWFHEPEPELVEPAAQWLDALGVMPGPRAAMERLGPHAPDVDTGWWVRLTPRTAPALAEAWSRRPPGIRWFGNDGMRGLLGPAQAFRPRISAKRHGVDLLVRSEWESEQVALSDEDLAKLRASASPWVKLAGGWMRRETVEALDQDDEWLADLGIEPGMGERTLGLWELAQARPESLEALERLGADAETIAAVRAMRERVATFSGLPHCEPPRGLHGTLRPYQQHGLDFLAHVSTLGMGAVLADDMGLGKTIQALAWLMHLREKTPGAGPSLVVCPASVVDNWRREAAQFAPGLRVLLLTSGANRRARMRDLASHDLVVTNYALLRRDAADWHDTPLFAAILDEAQHIKNPGAAVAQAAWGLRATHRLALTGTPLENRALDLWSIMQFANPGYLGRQRVFADRYDRVNSPPHVRRLLSARLRPVLLRRLKREVAPELPERIEELRTCEMLPAQKKLYLEHLRQAREDAVAAAAHGVREGEQRIQVLAALTRLRQICLHPRLAGGHEELGSGKFDALFELLEPLLAEGHKVLLFSQFVKALDLVRAEMRARDIPHHVLTGSTTDRPKVVSAFETDERACVFLISLRAGGTGLNLTAASYVVLLDPWWNPAVEAQAIDRTHRIGQDRTVIAYRLLMRGTIEEKIWELQQRKGELVDSVLGEDGFARSLDREALEYLFAEV